MPFVGDLVEEPGYALAGSPLAAIGSLPAVMVSAPLQIAAERIWVSVAVSSSSRSSAAASRFAF
jgi:hypothetical protein